MRLATLAVFFVATCALAQTATDAVQTDPAQETVLKIGQALEFGLQSNASTAYAWRVLADGAPILRQERASAAAEPPAPPMPGASRVQRGRYVSTQPGTPELRLEYRRPWLLQEPAARTVNYRVRVLAD